MLEILAVVALSVVGFAAVIAILGLPLWFWRLPAWGRRRLAQRGLVHVLQKQHLTVTDARMVTVNRRRNWLPSSFGRRLVFVYVGPPRRRPLKFNHSRRLRHDPVWVSVAISPEDAQQWLATARAWYRPIDKALAVDQNYSAPATVTGPLPLLEIAPTGQDAADSMR